MRAKSKNIVLLVLLASIVGLFAGGYAQRLPFSMSGTEQRIVVPLDGSKHILYGKQISSDMTKGLFFVNNVPIYNGETKNGVWLAHQKSTAGLFVLPVTSTFSLTGESDILPPEAVRTDPSMPKAGEVVYYHAWGDWDASDKYGALTYELTRSGSQIDYGSTVTRMRSGAYDTSISGAAGNKDAITGMDTLYREFKGSLSSGIYSLKISEWYNGIGSKGTFKSFSVTEPVQPDTTPPTVSSFTVDKSSFGKDDSITFKASVSDSGKEVMRVYVKWYNAGGYSFSLEGTGATGYELGGNKGSWFACGPSTVTLIAEDGAGNINSDNTLTVTLDCVTIPQPVVVWDIDKASNTCKQKSVSPSEAGTYYSSRESCEASLPKATLPPTTTLPLTTTVPPVSEGKTVVYKLSGDKKSCDRIEVAKSEAIKYYLSLESCKANIVKTGDSKVDNTNNLNRIKTEDPFKFFIGFLGTIVVGGLAGRRMKVI